MGSHDYQPFIVHIKVGEVPLTVHCKCTGSSMNCASVTFDMSKE